jgi:hypothetical protein
MIVLPKYKDLILPCGNMQVGIAGIFRMDAVNIFSGKKRELLPWTRNKILTSGRNIMGNTNNWAGNSSYCQVGRGTSAPLDTNTALEIWVAGTNTINANASGAQPTAPYYQWDRRTYRFPVGAVVGIISEVGVGWGASGSTLISRAKLVDELGAETSVTVISDEVLDVTYELRYYPPLVDVVGTVTLNGVVYNTVTRASSVNSGGTYIGQAIGQLSDFASDWSAYGGNLGTLIQAPSGAVAACDNANQNNLTYSNNSYVRDMQCNTGTTGWNVAGGIRSIRIRTTAGDFQTQFGTGALSGGLPTGSIIPKTSSFTMIMVWRIAWSEGVIP